ncbi:MAG TPA: YjfB family protein [Azonexus sp.]
MDIGAIGNLNPALSQARTGDAVAVLVMKKALDAQAQSALQLLQALPPVASNPANLGNSVDVRA